MTLSLRLAEHASTPVSADERDHLRTLTATNLAAAAGTLGHVSSFLGALPGADTPGDRAYRNGVVFHARTQDDFFPAGRSHVGAVVTAAVLAVADEMDASFYEAVAAGYRVLCAVAHEYAPDAQRRGLRPTGVFGPMGAAAATAWALGLDRQGVADAIAMAAALSGGTNQAWTAGSDEWALQAGLAARTGVEAAQLVSGGARAAHDAIEGTTGWSVAFFEDPAATRLAAALDRGVPGVEAVAIKPYPVSGIAQVPTTLACEAHRRAGDAPLSEVVLTMNADEAAYPGSLATTPQNRSAALMSVAFCVSSGLADGRVLLRQLEHPTDATGPTVRVEPTDALAETQARLTLRAGDAELVLEGHGEDVLFPPWSQTRAGATDLAERSEAPLDAVTSTVAELAAHEPDPVRLAAVATRTP